MQQASPRCDPMRGQRGKQNVGVDGWPYEFSLASSSSAPRVACDMCDSLGAGRGAGLRPSASSIPGVLFFEGHAEDFEQYVFESKEWEFWSWC